MNLTELFGNFPALSVALLTFATIGGVKFVRSLFKREWEDAAVIAVSALLPAVLSSFVDGITPLVGSIIGLGASGIITTVAYNSGNR